MDAKIVGANAVKVLEILEGFEPHLPIDEKMAVLDAAAATLRSTLTAEALKMATAQWLIGMGRK
jgi:hypothetical protein